MKLKTPTPCKRILQFFKLRLRKPLSIRAFHFRHPKCEPRKTTLRKRVAKIFPILGCLRPSRNMNRVMELKSFSEAGYSKAPFSSPLTPAYVRINAANKREVSGAAAEDVEDACTSFENYLVEMIVEDGKMKDLMDVEELLHCWNNLKSPIYIDLVCRFYGELCKDLFSNTQEEYASSSKTLAL